MNANKLAGLCLITLGLVNIFREVALRANGTHEPGFVYAFVTALLFTLGAALFWRKSARS